MPELAREVPSLANGGISRDGKTIVHHLRPNLQWSDGSPLTGADVVFTTCLEDDAEVDRPPTPTS